MQAGWKLSDGGRLDVISEKNTRRVVMEHEGVAFKLTISEARAVASALMGAAAEAA